MISVEQIRALEDRIEKALAFIANLKSENDELRSRNAGVEDARTAAEKRAEEAELRVLELEEAAETFRRDQLRIEEGIVHALQKLDAFEDLVIRGESSPPESLSSAAVPRQAKAPPREQSEAPAAVAPRGPSAQVPGKAEPPVSAVRTAEPSPRVEKAATDSELVGGSRPATDELDIF